MLSGIRGDVNLIHSRLKVFGATRKSLGLDWGQHTFFQHVEHQSLTDEWILTPHIESEHKLKFVWVTKQHKAIVLTEISNSHTRGNVSGHWTLNHSQHWQPTVHFQKGQVCRMPALVETSGTIWRHIVAAEGRLRGIWAQGDRPNCRSILEVAAQHAKDCDNLPLDKFCWLSNFRETGPVGNIQLYVRHRLFSRQKFKELRPGMTFSHQEYFVWLCHSLQERARDSARKLLIPPHHQTWS